MREEFHYLCNGNRCKICTLECYHTSDLSYALNFAHEPTEEEKRDRFMLVNSDPVNLISVYFERMEYVK